MGSPIPPGPRCPTTAKAFLATNHPTIIQDYRQYRMARGRDKSMTVSSGARFPSQTRAQRSQCPNVWLHWGFVDSLTMRGFLAPGEGLAPDSGFVAQLPKFQYSLK